jgi:long-subunit fatty acid transport protein
MTHSAEAISLRYSDVVVGGRSAQLGGAFAALADDATAAYYNPAGLAQISTSSLSLSANALDVQTYTIENRIAGHDIELTSEAFYPTAWGVVKKWGSMRIALSAIVIANLNAAATIRLQDVAFQGLPFNTLTADATAQEQTYLAGPSIAYPIRPDLMIGGTVYYWYGNTLQDQTIFVETGDPVIQAEVTSREEALTYGLLAQAGLLLKPSERYSVGVVVRTPTFLQQEIDFQNRSYSFDEASSEFVREFEEGEDTRSARRPSSATVGTAVHPNDHATVALDLSYYHSTEYTSAGQKIRVEPVVNGALGGEWMLNPRVALRAGLYTNFSAAPELNDRPAAQPDHVDYYGFTMGTGYLDAVSTLETGLRYAYGTGESKDPVTGERFAVRAEVYALFVSGSIRF